MAGDNNLSENMVYALDELDKFRSNLPENERNRTNMLAFFDGSSPTAPTYYIDYTPEKTYFHEIEKKDLVRKCKKDVGSNNGKNAASPYSLINFVNWCVNTRKCKAENYAFILSGHSSGFTGDTMLADAGSNSYMTIFNLRWALEEIKKDFLDNKKIAILGFDSCLMSMLEVGYELKDVAQTIVASEGNLPNAGWAYVPMFKKLIGTLAEHSCEKMKNSGMSVKTAAKCFVEAFVEQQKRYAVGGRSVDLAAWDLDEVETVAEALKTLADCLLEKLNLPKLEKKGKLEPADIFIYEELKKAILQSHVECQTFMHNQCIDLKDFCERLFMQCQCLEKNLEHFGVKTKAFDEVKTGCAGVIEAVGKCVLKSGFCGDEYQFSNGISLYFPWTWQNYAAKHDCYRFLQFVRGAKSKQSEVDASINRIDSKNEIDEKGKGKSWNDFLFYYLLIVTMRRTRNNSQSFKAYFKTLAESPLSKENWIFRTREKWIFRTKENWIFRTRENWIFHTKGGLSASPETGGQIRNYELDWEISGFSDARAFDAGKVECKYKTLIGKNDSKNRK